VIYDRRGYGRSERGPDFEEFYVSERFRAESVNELAMLLDTLHIEAFHAVGQCEGGVIGVDYAVQYPGQVKSLVMASTMCRNTIPMPEFNRTRFTRTFYELDPALRAKFMWWHGEEFAEPLYEQFVQFGGAYGKDFFDLRQSLPMVQCPTLVLYPDRSFLFEVEQAVEMYRHLPHGELAVNPHCGHNTYEQQPEEYVRIVVNFLERQARQAMFTEFAEPVTCIGAAASPKPQRESA
jgi:pimeloyl-ACP methyl ester carboxylesterase